MISYVIASAAKQSQRAQEIGKQEEIASLRSQ
jgi:hypothetical protein